jgi:hypothetical protein
MTRARKDKWQELAEWAAKQALLNAQRVPEAASKREERYFTHRAKRFAQLATYIRQHKPVGIV